MKRLALLFALLAAAAPAAAQVNRSVPTDLYPAATVTTFTCGLNAIAATLTQCQAAPAAGLKLYVTSVHVQTTTTTSGTYAIQTGTGSNCGTGTAAMFPVSGTSNRFNAPITSNAMASLIFPVPLAAPAASAVCLIGVATNTISVQITGFTAP